MIFLPHYIWAENNKQGHAIKNVAQAETHRVLPRHTRYARHSSLQFSFGHLLIPPAI